MDSKDQSRRKILSKEQSRIERESVLFEKLIPIALIVMGVLTVAVIVLALGVLLGFVKF